MMLGLLPKMLVILALFLALFDPPPVSGTSDPDSSVKIKSISFGDTTRISSLTYGSGLHCFICVFDVPYVSLRSGAKEEESCKGDDTDCDMGEKNAVCWKTIKEIKISKGEVTWTRFEDAVDIPMTCNSDNKGAETCYCDDKDFCSGGISLERKDKGGLNLLPSSSEIQVYCEP